MNPDPDRDDSENSCFLQITRDFIALSMREKPKDTRFECRGCGIAHRGNWKGNWCDLCRNIVPHITGQDASMIESSDSVEEIRQELGHPDSRPNRIWSAIRQMDSPEADWVARTEPYDEIGRIGGPPPSWEIDEGDIDLIGSGSISGFSTDRLRRLQRGGILPDGSHLCWADGRFTLDGITVKVPYRGLSKLLKRKRGLKDVDWKKLLLSIDLANKRFRDPSGPRNHNAGRETTIHPVALLLGKGSSWISGAMRFGYLGMGRRRSVDMLLNYNPTWYEGASWMDAWDDNVRLTSANIADMVVPTALFVKKGRLQLRVRRPGGWRRLEVESHPEVWAKVVTWALSPPDSKHQKRLHCVQQGLFSDTEIELISKSDRNGIQMLRGIIEENDKVSLQGGPDGGFIVEGSSGARYRVMAGVGGHNTRFVVRGIEPVPTEGREGNMPPWMHRDRLPICVVETPQLRSLVIGDALSSVIMALLDDLRSQQHIDTLRNYIHEVRPRPAVEPAVAEFRQAENLRFRLRNNLADFRTRRYTVLFPRLWGVLLRLPLGERMEFTAIRRDRPNLTFDGCGSEFSTRDMMERRVVYRMLEAAGWQRDRYEEQVRGHQRFYIRTGTGPQNLANLVEGFAEMLEPMLTVNERVRLVANPAWTFFERNNPGICALLPGTNERLD